MRGAPFNPQGAGVLQAAEVAEKGGIFWSGFKRKREGEVLEPTSVLDKRSPSPPTSTSTLSSSLGGGSGSSDTAGVAAVSGNTANRWPADDGGADRKEEWASDLQPIPDSLVEMGLAGGERLGLGVEDWEAMLAESAASPGQEQTFLRWIMRDMDDASSGLKQQHHHQQLLSHGPVEFDGGNGSSLGFGLVDQGFGFDPIEGMGGGTSFSASALNPLSLASTVSLASGFQQYSSSNTDISNSRAPVSMPKLAAPSLLDIKVPNFGNPTSNPLLSPPSMNSLMLQPSLPLFQEPLEEKPQVFFPAAPLNPGFFMPIHSFAAQHDHQQPQHQLQSQPKRHHADPAGQMSPKTTHFPDSGGPNLFLRRHQPQHQQHQLNPGIPWLQPTPYHLQQRPMKAIVAGDEAAAAVHQQQQALVDQLLKAAELVEAGNTVSARGILARLNHQLPSSLGKPLLRSAFYFKEALNLLAGASDSPNTSAATQHRSSQSTSDVVLKLGAYKAFSEVSPLLQFTNFTCTQALLEEVGGADNIHIIDFDIGVGGQWSSFMQELAHRRPNAAPMLKITAFVSPCSHHPLELHLTRENLSHFAADLDIPFEFSALNLDSFDPAELLGMSAGSDETIAVNLPVGSGYNPPIPSLLRLLKQLAPKIVVSVDQGCDRSDLPFSHHFLHGLQSCMVLLDSIDASGTSSDVASKIERFLLQPRIESTVLGRYRAGDKVPPWRTLFASAGFLPMHFSNFTETQAECLLKRVQVRGFHVEKRQASLFLNWQHRELASVSAWRC